MSLNVTPAAESPPGFYREVDWKDICGHPSYPYLIKGVRSALDSYYLIKQIRVKSRPFYNLDYENSKNPFQERREQIYAWKKHSEQDIQENPDIIKIVDALNQDGFQKIDSLHIACAFFLKCDYFLTTDDTILKKARSVEKIHIDDPIGFIKEVLS